MGLMSRAWTVLRSNLNDLISRSEDPEKMLSQIVIDMQQQLGRVKQEVAAAVADEKRLEQQHLAEAEQAKEWERKATLAVEKGQDDLAREALRRQGEHARYAVEYRKQWEIQRESTEKLRAGLHDLSRKIEEARRKKNLLVARHRRAEAQAKIHETMSGLSDTSAFETFDRMAAKVDETEARAAAAVELGEELTGEALEKKFAALESGQDVEQALAALKARSGKTG